jgi:hypothetical protein
MESGDQLHYQLLLWEIGFSTNLSGLDLAGLALPHFFLCAHLISSFLELFLPLVPPILVGSSFSSLPSLSLHDLLFLSAIFLTLCGFVLHTCDFIVHSYMYLCSLLDLCCCAMFSNTSTTKFQYIVYTLIVFYSVYTINHTDWLYLNSISYLY